MARIAINGLGRMGKLVLRAFVEDGTPGEIVLLNDRVGDPATARPPARVRQRARSLAGQLRA